MKVWERFYDRFPKVANGISLVAETAFFSFAFFVILVFGIGSEYAFEAVCIATFIALPLTLAICLSYERQRDRREKAAKALEKAATLWLEVTIEDNGKGK